MIALHATLKRVAHDEDGESLVTLRVPASELAKAVGLAALHRTLLLVQIGVADENDALQTPREGHSRPVSVGDRPPDGSQPTQAQYAKSEKLMARLGWPEAEWRARLTRLCGVSHRSDLTRIQMSQWLTHLEGEIEKEVPHDS